MAVEPSELSDSNNLIVVDEVFEPLSISYLQDGSISVTDSYRHDEFQKFVRMVDLERERDGLDKTKTLDTVCLLQILYYRTKKDVGEKVFNRKKGDVSEASYDRLLMVRCVLSPPGSNVFAILMSNQRNAKLFDQYLSLRDHQGFTPGTYVTVENPQVIENYMGNLPLFDSTNPFRIVDTRRLSFLPVMVSNDSPRMSCFHFSTAKLELLNMSVITVPCRGVLCDALNMLNNGRLEKSCSCISSTSSKLPHVVMVVKILVHPSVGPSFVVTDFTSHKFTRMFVKNGARGMPPGLSSTTITSHQGGSFFRKYSRLVDQAMTDNEFSVTGWSRRGTITDQGTGGKDSVKNSTLVHHIVSIDSKKPIDESKKVDFSNLMNHLNVNPSKKRKQSIATSEDN